MLISDVIAAVMADMNIGRAQALATLIGEKHLAENDAPPRIVWLPTTDEFSPARLAGGTPRPLWDMVANYSLHLWADTIDAARQMELDAVAAMHRVMHAGIAASSLRFKPTGATWHNEGELQTSGVQLELMVSFTMTVTDRPQAIANLTHITGALSESESGETINFQVP
jgi:hypothetical protein